MHTPDFIFMLTRADATVPDAIEHVVPAIAGGVTHIGVKDVGLPRMALQELARLIRSHGAQLYLEVVSLDAASERASAEVALDLGVDALMDGTRPDVVVPIIAGAPMRYYPFPGRITGHPSILQGPIEAIVASAQRLAAREGVHGLDLLAYRFAGDVPRLMRAVCAAVPVPVVMAGSIDRAARIAAIVQAGAAAFTVGTAALDGVVPASSRSLKDQLRAIFTLRDQAIRARAASR